MKINAAHLALLGFFGLASVLLGQSTGKSSVSPPHGDPFTPVGSISVTPTVVQPGVQPNMVWGIEYPKAVEDLSEIDPGGGVTPKTTVDLKLRVMGVAWQYGNTLLPTALWVRVGAGSGWELVFFGSGADVNPEEVVFEKKGILPGTRIMERSSPGWTGQNGGNGNIGCIGWEIGPGAGNRRQNGAPNGE